MNALAKRKSNRIKLDKLEFPICIEGNGMMMTLFDASEPLPNIISQSVKGNDGKIYKSGVFDTLVYETEDGEGELPVFIYYIEKMPNYTIH